jgi:cysteine desulfurase
MADRDGVGNPSSVHRAGQRARGIVEAARRKVAAAVGAEALEVTFTSGGTEADALAVLGVVRALRRQGRPAGLLTSPLEHPAVRGAADRLRSEGESVIEVSCDAQGRLDAATVSASLEQNPEVGLVSLAAANHELGNLYDIKGLTAALRTVRQDILVHTDAVQAFGKVPVDFSDWDVDLMSISAHKIHGPTGVGALIHRQSLAIDPLVPGGHQERGRRPGTENLLGIHGFGLAAELAVEEMATHARTCELGRQRLRNGLERLPGCRILGDLPANVGNTVLASFEGCEGEMLAMNLDLEGFAVSTGAACTAGTVEPSPVVLALGFSEQVARSTLRFSFGRHNRTTEVDDVLDALPPIIERVRAALVQEGRAS